jgi:hypothetical protein
MATVLGAGSALATAWLLDPVLAVRSHPAPPPAPSPPVERVRVDLPETLDLLSRITWLLRGNAAGLSLTQLRGLLAEPSDSLQRALAAGLRSKRLRRVGAHNKLRYVLNG